MVDRKKDICLTQATKSFSEISYLHPGVDPGRVDGVASHPPFQMKKK